MRCGAVHNMMVEFATDGIDPARESAFRAHLSGCPRCRAEWAEIEEANAALAAYALPMPDDAFFERMTHAVMAATGSQTQAVRRPAFGLRWATASALACLVLAAGFWHQSGGPQPAGPATSSVATGLAAPSLVVAQAPPEPVRAAEPTPTKPAPAAQPAPVVAPAARPRPAVRLAERQPTRPTRRVRFVATTTRLAAAVPTRHTPQPIADPVPMARLAISSADVEPSVSDRVADAAAVRARSGMGDSPVVAMGAVATLRADSTETRGVATASETLVMAAAPEVLDLGTSTLVVRLAEAPSGERKRTVSPAVSVVGATLVHYERELDQP